MNEIQKYFKKHNALIQLYTKGDLTKREYLEENLNLALSQNFKPFKNVDTAEKALFNYQYYNAHAKALSSQASAQNIPYEQKHALRGSANDYYQRKDRATLTLLSILDYQHVYGYYIKVRSKYLKEKLIEIVVEEPYYMILHTTSAHIISKMRDENIFIEEKRKSLIDHYINQKY